MGTAFLCLAPSGCPPILHGVVNSIRKLTEPLMNLVMITAEEGAQTQLYCATANVQSGQYYQDCAPKDTNGNLP